MPCTARPACGILPVRDATRPAEVTLYESWKYPVLVVIFVLLALAILFISQNGGWQGGCGGNCASCHHKCADPKPKDDSKT